MTPATANAISFRTRLSSSAVYHQQKLLSNSFCAAAHAVRFPPSTCRWRSPPEPVADGGAVVEKSVFGIMHETRQLWVQLLCGQAPRQRVASPVPAGAAPSPLTDGAAATTEHDATAVSRDEAEEFISNVIQICINLMNENNAQNLMKLALECVEAWLQQESHPHTHPYNPFFYTPFQVAHVQLAHGLREQFPPSKFLPALWRLAAAHNTLGDGPNWLQPKGVGVVCVAKKGIPKDSFVHFYFGKMYEHRTRVRGMSQVSRDPPLSYQPSKWFEREAAIEVIKVTTSARACKSQPTLSQSRVPEINGLRGDFYNMMLEVPASLPGGYCPLGLPPPHPPPPLF